MATKQNVMWAEAVSTVMGEATPNVGMMDRISATLRDVHDDLSVWDGMALALQIIDMTAMLMQSTLRELGGSELDLDEEDSVRLVAAHEAHKSVMKVVAKAILDEQKAAAS